MTATRSYPVLLAKRTQLCIALFLCLVQLLSGSPPLSAADLSPAPPSAPNPSNPDSAHASQARAGLQVNPSNREESINFYLNYYVSTQDIPPDWNGNHDACLAGDTTPGFRAAVLQRINYFRAMAGVPADVTFRDDYNRKAQAAALMMSANNALDHGPPRQWRCYTDDGHDGARHSNLFLGVRSPDAVDGYIEDPGGGNHVVGHRRWIFFPQTRAMGTGDIPQTAGYAAANALWVIDSEHYFDERPATRDGFVAWPPPGFVPNHLIFDRWSISYPGAEFQDAAVTMLVNGQPVTVQVLPGERGYGENTLVWEPPRAVLAANRTAESTFAVSITNVRVDGQARSFDYAITAYQPPDFDQANLTNRLYIPLVRR
ncbi:MAG: hypothetical protein KJZ93_27035 [Caldilineaceae bacterium]|nr:hypothetical protein [Caldilineaceae bacterium]